VVVNELPEVDAGPELLACYGEEIQLFTEAENIVSYSWVPADHIDDPSASNPVFTLIETTDLTVTVVDVNGCINAFTFTVELDPVPVAYAGLDTIIYLGESAWLDAIGGGEFSWSPEEFLSNPNSLTTYATPPVTTNFVLSVLSEAGCFSSDTVTVFVTDVPLVVFPNAFSPNADSFNDFFAPFSRGEVASFQFWIYNRWGEVVYETSDPAVLGVNPNIGWDGTLDGENQPMGAYVYLLTLRDLIGRDYTYTGSFTLIR
jgi:gliding motility-associated-like protein